MQFILGVIKPFLANVRILYPLKTTEKQMFFSVFRGYKMEEPVTAGIL